MRNKNNFINRLGNAAVTVTFVTILLGASVFCASLFITVFLGLSYSNPSDHSVGKLNNRIYYPTSEVVAPNKTLPTLSDIGVEMQEYAHMSASSNSYPFMTHSKLVLSTTDSVTEPTNLSTVVYETFKSSVEPILDYKEKSLRKKYDNNFVDAELDYGSKSAYWLGDRLVLRYDGRLLVIDSEPSRSLIDTELFANAMRNKNTAP